MVQSLASCGMAKNSMKQFCRLFKLTHWYLPSKAELNLLYKQKAVVGGFASSGYWSSTESDSFNAWRQTFNSNGYQYVALKNAMLRVRAIRAF